MSSRAEPVLSVVEGKESNTNRVVPLVVIPSDEGVEKSTSFKNKNLNKKHKYYENHKYYVYITTNQKKTTSYIGVTNDLARRLEEHFQNRGDLSTYAGKYYCYNLIYFEEFKYIDKAIAREKELE